ncbi:MAG: protein kinase domain-containing protein [Candidatus Sumerlaeaceae bacterium]
MDVNGPLDFPDDPNVSWRPDPGKEFSHRLDEVFAQTTPLPPRSVAGDINSALTSKAAEKRPAAYLLNSVVAQGGHGEIWKAVQVSLSRSVAVKKVRRKYYQQGGEQSLRLLEMAFHKEALVTGRLDHPSIVPIYDIGADQNGRPLLAMKLVLGTEWTNVIIDDAQLDRSAFFAKHLPILLSVAQAVAFAHSRAVIHRDLKPSQVMVGEYGEVYLMDWGLAAIFDDLALPVGDAPTLPYSVSAKDAINPAGTTCYMAPEQTESTGERLGPWTDIFLLGGILYRLLTETPPYDEETSKKAFEKARNGIVDPPELRAPYLEIPHELSRIAMQALSREIGDRYSSVQEFIAALEAYLHGTNRRTESQNLTEQAARLFEQSPTYPILSQADNILSRALNLWADNTDAYKLQQQGLVSFAELAVSQGDLGLARLQAHRVANGGSRDLLVSRIEEKALRLARLRTQRKVALAACFVLVIALAGLGQHMVQSRANARIRQHQQRVDNQVKQREQNQRESEAAAAKQRAETARRTSDLYAAEQQLTRDLVQEWAPQLSIPPTLAVNPYDENVSREKHSVRTTELQSRLTETGAIRNALSTQGLGSQPSSLPYAAGIMTLYSGAKAGDFAEAQRLLQLASQSGAERHQAFVALAVIDFRTGRYNDALSHLDSAGRLALETMGREPDYRKVLALAHEVGRKQAEHFQLGPQDVLIEPRAGGQNFSHYMDSGGWKDSNKPHEWAKSCAPGTTQLPLWGSRAVRFFSGVSNEETTFPSIAQYQPLLTARQHFYVYATWPFSANAAPVNYRVQHANGETSYSIIQDGWSGILSTNANLWTALGDYDFEPGDKQGVELHVDSDVRPVRRGWNGQAVADAVLFSTRALTELTTQPRTASSVVGPVQSIAWISSYEDALRLAKSGGKRLLIYVTPSQSSHLTFCESNVFPNDKVLRAFENFVAVTVSSGGNRPENYRFAGVPTGTLILCDINGSEYKRIPPEKVLSTDVLLSELNL